MFIRYLQCKTLHLKLCSIYNVSQSLYTYSISSWNFKPNKTYCFLIRVQWKSTKDTAEYFLAGLESRTVRYKWVKDFSFAKSRDMVLVSSLTFLGVIKLLQVIFHWPKISETCKSCKIWMVQPRGFGQTFLCNIMCLISSAYPSQWPSQCVHFYGNEIIRTLSECIRDFDLV